MFRSDADAALMRAIARRQPILRMAAEHAVLPIIAERKKPQKGGYIYTPLLSHPLEFGMDKFENDKAIRRLRLASMEKRVEAAVAQNLPWAVEELYMTGAPCNIPNKSGYTPLHLAAARNFPGCVKVLLNMKTDIDVNAVTKKGYTALYLATSCSAPECARYLAAAGGKMTVLKPKSGYRSILDVPIDIPEALPFANRAADDKARNLQGPTYFGQY